MSKNPNIEVDYPKNSCRSCFSSDMRGDFTTMLEYTMDYMDKNKNSY